MVEREGIVDPRKKRHKVAGALGVVLSAQAIAAPYILTHTSRAEAYQARTTSVPSVTNEIPLFPAIPGVKDKPQLIEIGEKTEYTQITGTFISIDPRPDMTFVVVKQDSGNFLHLFFWDENVAKGHKNPAAKYRSEMHGMKQDQKVIIDVPTGKISREDARTYIAVEKEKGSTDAVAKVFMSAMVYLNRARLDPNRPESMIDEDQYIEIKSDGIKPILF